ncbi:SsgA family sporulation/cell division regulator [Streptomyces sp. CAU 1734]|uniref:SsgA family sporulation/cell division regulator n=1 Tax=Streptomyces sp. CAU 1734 TaxID=3140360 RepID=UPI00326171FA
MFPTVEQSIPAHLISNTRDPAPVTVSLTYGIDDPFAVRMVFPASVSLNGTSVTWVFARSLLDSGLHGPSGGGDVHIWPYDRTRTMVELRSAAGLALLRFATGPLRRFLLHTYATVPAELESGALDVDGALRVLLRGAKDWQD